MNNLIPVSGDALLVTDVQNDFLPGGNLAVPQSNSVVPVLNRCIKLFKQKHLPVYACRDWHPVNHSSFHVQGGPWPPHCIAGTRGAAFADNLELPADVVVISKADKPEREAYSAFSGTDLDRRLTAAGIKRLFVGGLTTDYCVLNTVKDALALDYSAIVIIDAVRAVDITPGDGELAFAEMRRLGARFAFSQDFVS
jgi:nicotinamidase/pyrazinamidase